MKYQVHNLIDQCLHHNINGEDKKNKYLDACLKQRRKFTPLVASVDRLLWVEVEATIKRIAIRLAKKWKDP